MPIGTRLREIRSFPPVRGGAGGVVAVDLARKPVPVEDRL
jgi:hypothetical protein